MYVEPPKDFQRIGFSGRFHTIAETNNPELWKKKVPCLIHDDQWMALSVEGNKITIVRKDMAAIGDLFTKPIEDSIRNMKQ